MSRGSAAAGEGLLYLPYVSGRIPVEWQGLRIMESDDGTYGCVTAGEVIAQGSNGTVLTQDLNRQLMALLTQGPGSFSGKFGEALEELERVGKDLLDDNPVDPQKTIGAIKASKDGFAEYKAMVIQKYAGLDGSLPSDVQAIADRLTFLQNALEQPEACFAQNVRPTTNGSGKNSVIKFFAVADCKTHAELLSSLATEVNTAKDILATRDFLPLDISTLPVADGPTEAYLRDALSFGGEYTTATVNGKTYEFKKWNDVYVIKYNGETYWYADEEYYILGTCVDNADPTTARAQFKKCTAPNNDGTCTYTCIDLEIGTGIGTQAADLISQTYVKTFEYLLTAGTAATWKLAIGEVTLQGFADYAASADWSKGTQGAILAFNIYLAARGERALSTEQFRALENLLSASGVVSYLKKFPGKAKEVISDVIKKVVSGAGSFLAKLDNLGLTALKTEINLLDDVAKAKFLDEFAGASDDVLRALNSEKDLVGIWRNISHLKSEANSVSFLQWVKKAKNSHLPIHLKGEVNQLNNAVGCHLQSAVDGSRVKILPTPPPVYNGSELVRAKIEIGGVPKDALSTFFPKSWDEARVLEEVALIIKNPSNQVGTNIRKFQGLASDGVTKIEIRLSGPNNNLNFDTVFPY